MTSSKRQNVYLNQRVILFRLQYETHILQINPKSPCRSAPLLKVPDREYALRLVVIPCQYFPIPSPSFQPTSPSALSHISSVAVPHLQQHDRLPLSSPLTFSVIPIRPHLHRTFVVILLSICCGPYCIIFLCPVYFATIVCLPSRIGSSPRSLLFYTTLLAPLCYALHSSLSDLIFSLRFSLLFWHVSSLSP